MALAIIFDIMTGLLVITALSIVPYRIIMTVNKIFKGRLI
jgi:hypothetical protein